MVALKEIVRHPTHAFDHVMSSRQPHSHKKAYSIIGLIAIGLGIYACITLYPELHRYIRIKRM
jgi:hypothetical protein